MALTIADVQITPGLLVTPIANTTLIMRDIFRGQTNLGHLAIASISSFVYAGLLLSVAARLFSNEQLVNPAWEPLSLKGLGGIGRSKAAKRPPRLPAIDEAIALFAIFVLLLFYIQPRLLIRLDLASAMIITQVFLVFGPAAAMAWMGNWRWREAFKLRTPTAGSLAGALLLGVGLAPVAALFTWLQSRFWPPGEMQKLNSELIEKALRAHPLMIPLVIGVFAGVFEELFFRGAIQSGLLRKARRPFTPILITSIIFAAAHLDIHGMPIRTLLGLVLGWIVYHTGSIFPAMIVHATYNSTQLFIAAWQIRHHDPTAELTLDANFWLRLAVGIAMTSVGAWLIHRSKHSAVRNEQK
jgi:membrane protease YdiL (CAAX protease family)